MRVAFLILATQIVSPRQLQTILVNKAGFGPFSLTNRKAALRSALGCFGGLRRSPNFAFLNAWRFRWSSFLYYSLCSRVC